MHVAGVLEIIFVPEPWNLISKLGITALSLYFAVWLICEVSRMHSRAYMLLEKEWFKLQKDELPWVSCVLLNIISIVNIDAYYICFN